MQNAMMQQREEDMEQSNTLLKERVNELTQELRQLKRKTAVSPDPAEVRHVLKKLEESEMRVRLAEEAARALAEEVDSLQRRLVPAPPPPLSFESPPCPPMPPTSDGEQKESQGGGHATTGDVDIINNLERELQETQER